MTSLTNTPCKHWWEWVLFSGSDYQFWGTEFGAYCTYCFKTMTVPKDNWLDEQWLKKHWLQETKESK